MRELGPKGTIAHAVIMTADQNKFPRESALLTLGWITMSGGDYKQALTPEKTWHASNQKPEEH